LGLANGQWRIAALGLALSVAAAGPVVAHPHVWVTVKSKLTFTPDGKIPGIVHDWVFEFQRKKPMPGPGSSTVMPARA
jgi:ABC-type uncharacterized transport system substrate-binding protein